MTLKTNQYIGIPIVFFGDSISEGQCVDPQYRWTDLILRNLKETYVNSSIDIIGFNKGISGETSRQGLLRFEKDVQNISPDILTIQFGLNDCNRWFTDKGLPRVSEKSFRANLEEMIDRAQHFSVKHIILSNNHPTLRKKLLPGGKSLEEARMIYNEIIKEVALCSEVIFCNIEQWFLEIEENKYAEYLLPMPDGLHLSKSGHEHYTQKMLSIIQPCIEDIIKYYQR